MTTLLAPTIVVSQGTEVLPVDILSILGVLPANDSLFLYDDTNLYINSSTDEFVYVKFPTFALPTRFRYITRLKATDPNLLAQYDSPTFLLPIYIILDDAGPTFFDEQNLTPTTSFANYTSGWLDPTGYDLDNIEIFIEVFSDSAAARFAVLEIQNDGTGLDVADITSWTITTPLATIIIPLDDLQATVVVDGYTIDLSASIAGNPFVYAAEILSGPSFDIISQTVSYQIEGNQSPATAQGTITAYIKSASDVTLATDNVAYGPQDITDGTIEYGPVTSAYAPASYEGGIRIAGIWLELDYTPTPPTISGGSPDSWRKNKLTWTKDPGSECDVLFRAGLGVDSCVDGGDGDEDSPFVDDVEPDVDPDIDPPPPPVETCYTVKSYTIAGGLSAASNEVCLTPLQVVYLDATVYTDTGIGTYAPNAEPKNTSYT